MMITYNITEKPKKGSASHKISYLYFAGYETGVPYTDYLPALDCRLDRMAMDRKLPTVRPRVNEKLSSVPVLSLHRIIPS